jgi:aspartyl-tRNA(Asn)/glutamyl-tRNA(Gln) amidotransferase subunit C
VVDAGNAERHEKPILLRSWFACQLGPRLLAKPGIITTVKSAMSVDKDTVRRIAKLARIALEEERVEPMMNELNQIFAWVEQLGEVDIAGVPPMTSVVEQKLRMRDDKVTAGGDADAITANAPLSEDHFFVVPKVVE